VVQWFIITPEHVWKNIGVRQGSIPTVVKVLDTPPDGRSDKCRGYVKTPAFRTNTPYKVVWVGGHIEEPKTKWLGRPRAPEGGVGKAE
jgi:hypothetical protein